MTTGSSAQNPSRELLTERFTEELIERALDLALLEDLGEQNCDLTTDSIVDPSTRAQAVVLLKQPAVVAGLPVFARVFKRLSKDIEIIQYIEEGKLVEETPLRILSLEGPAREILKGERLALNLLQRMSGVATMARRFVDLAAPHGIKILDTRKTTPGMRVFEKQAVMTAGASNHRFGLFDYVLIKENHIVAAGSITSAVERVRKAHPSIAVQTETQNLEEVSEALECKVETILLDNMTPAMVRDAIELVKGRCKVEVSGGINLNNIESYLIAGVDRISIGALTHSAPAVDISLDVTLLT